MSRDPHKLRVFHAADRLAVRTYQTTGRFPREERFGLLGQLRRAAVSVACNIVGGSARPGGQAYVHFLNTALASASEARYLADLCARLELLPATQAAELKDEYDALCRSLQSLINTVEPPRPPKA